MKVWVLWWRISQASCYKLISIHDTEEGANNRMMEDQVISGEWLIEGLEVNRVESK